MSTGDYNQHLSRFSNRSSDDYDDVGDGCSIQYQTYGHLTQSPQTNQRKLEG